MTPFWNTQNTFWASAAVQDTSKLGYTYPDFNGVDLGNTEATQTAISKRVNQLYGSAVFGSSFASFAATPRSIQASRSVVDTAKKAPTPPHHAIQGFVKSLADTAKHALASSPSTTPPAPQQHALSTQVTEHSRDLHPHAAPHVVHEPSFAAPDRGLWEWTARVEFKKYELGASFSVLIFLGQIPEDPRGLRTSHNYVGGHHAFVNSAPNSCANCTSQRDLVTEGFIHINHGIAKHSTLGSLDPHVIVPYLTEKLQWVVQKVSCLFLLYLQICTDHCLSVKLVEWRGGTT